jgi:CxxC-x17-CxxC domain-containing protein
VVDVFAKKDDSQRDNRRDDRRSDSRPQVKSSGQATNRSPQPSAKSLAPASAAKADKSPAKPAFATKCDNCGVKIEVNFVPDTSRAVFCKDCLKKSRRGEISIKAPKAVEVVDETVTTPSVSLAQLNKQTVDFKGRPVKQKESPQQTARPRIEPPPIRERQSQKTEVQPIKNMQPVSKKLATLPIMPAPPKAMPIEKPEPKEVSAPVKNTASVNLLDQFGGEDQGVKAGEEVEL